MMKIMQVVLMAFYLLGAASCGRRADRLPRGVEVDLVDTWGLGHARKVVLKGGPREARHVILSSPEEIREFFADFASAIKGGDKLLTVMGSIEVDMEDGTNFRIILLVDTGREWKHDQVAVQRLRRGDVESYYYLPDRFLNQWEERLGKLR
jgi:hypothetical protein